MNRDNVYGIIVATVVAIGCFVALSLAHEMDKKLALEGAACAALGGQLIDGYKGRVCARLELIK